MGGQTGHWGVVGGRRGRLVPKVVRRLAPVIYLPAFECTLGPTVVGGGRWVVGG